MTLFRKPIRANGVELVVPAEAFCDPREPGLAIGNFVRLNSGGPVLTVVDLEAEMVVVAWRDQNGLTREAIFPAGCLHRYQPNIVQSSI